MNPILALPPPVIVQDGEDKIIEGAALSTHDTSVVNWVATPETTVDIGPDVGVSVNVGGGPALTVKLVVAESPRPAFVSTLTV